MIMHEFQWKKIVLISCVHGERNENGLLYDFGKLKTRTWCVASAFFQCASCYLIFDAIALLVVCCRRRREHGSCSVWYVYALNNIHRISLLAILSAASTALCVCVSVLPIISFLLMPSFVFSVPRARFLSFSLAVYFSLLCKMLNCAYFIVCAPIWGIVFTRNAIAFALYHIEMITNRKFYMYRIFGSCIDVFLSMCVCVSGCAALLFLYSIHSPPSPFIPLNTIAPTSIITKWIKKRKHTQIQFSSFGMLFSSSKKSNTFVQRTNPIFKTVYKEQITDHKLKFKYCT